MTEEDIRDRIVKIVKDDAEKLAVPLDYLFALEQALTKYSQYRPRVLSQIIAVTANAELDTASITSFDPGFIDQIQIESPISTTGKPTFLDRNDWIIIDTVVGTVNTKVIRFIRGVNALANVRVVHRVLHVRPATPGAALTVRGSDANALVYWGASVCLQMLAHKYTQSSEKQIMNADIANFENKGRDYETRARTLRDQFYAEFERPGMVMVA